MNTFSRNEFLLPRKTSILRSISNLMLQKHQDCSVSCFHEVCSGTILLAALLMEPRQLGYCLSKIIIAYPPSPTRDCTNNCLKRQASKPDSAKSRPRDFQMEERRQMVKGRVTEGDMTKWVRLSQEAFPNFRFKDSNTEA